MFPLYKVGDEVIIYSKRHGTVRGTLYAINSNTITVNSRVIARMDIPEELIIPSLNARKRNLERNRRQSKFNYLIRLEENKIQDIEKSYQREKDKIETEVSKAEKVVRKLEYGKNRAYDMLRNHRDEANRYKLLTIKPVDYNQIIKAICSDGGFQWSDNAEIDNSVNASEPNKPSQQIEIKDNNHSVDRIKPAQILLKTPHDLTANSSNPNFRVWSSSESTDQSAYGAMNGNIQEGCVYHSRKEMRPWWAIKFNNPVCVKSFWIQNRSMNTSGPAVFITKLLIQGSDDGTNWKTIKHFQLSNEPTVKSTVELPPNTFFSFYRIIAAARNYNIRNNYLIFGELEFQYYEMDSSGNSDDKNKSDTYQETESTLGTRNNISSQGNIKDFPEIITLPNGTKIEMVKVEAGTFTMGGRDRDSQNDEKPLHQVTLTDDFWIGKYEVTQQQYRAVMGFMPAVFQGNNLPMENLSWYAAVDFCEKLNDLTKDSRPRGYKFSLPTEAQWEYAARGGRQSSESRYSGNDNIENVSWYSGNSGRRTHPVGQKQPNELGLFDMSGNVWEWCLDSKNTYTSSNNINPVHIIHAIRVCRGGSCNNQSWHSRPSRRIYIIPTEHHQDIGFRLALIKDIPQIKSRSEYHENKEYVLTGDSPYLMLPGRYIPPYTIYAKCKTCRYNIRFFILHGELIFNWECDAQEFLRRKTIRSTASSNWKCINPRPIILPRGSRL